MNYSGRCQSVLAPGGTVLIMMVAVASANAADAPIPYGAPPPQYGPAPYAPPPPPLVPAPPPLLPAPMLPCLWLGPYVGANAGFQWTSQTNGFGASGVIGG